MEFKRANWNLVLQSTTTQKTGNVLALPILRGFYLSHPIYLPRPSTIPGGFSVA